MNLYLDDHLAEPALAEFLRKLGHDVVLPVDLNSSGASDARHLERAAITERLVMTEDREDFHDLHDLVLTCGGQHPGILVIRYDDDPRHDMKPKHIGTAIANLESAGVPLMNEIVVLNQWR